MKLTSIRLQNVRRFSDPVEIAGISPGLNLLSAPNEQGKSTIFDALHALFFKDAKSWDKDIRALAPHAGGDPDISVTLMHNEAEYRVAKTFTKSAGKGSAKIWQDGTLIHQADAAEAWLRDLITAPKDDGPAAMLWVRQGLTDFADAKDTLGARRDLMSSLSGEIGTITGGQQMERLRRQVKADLDRQITTRGSARKGGSLAEAEARLADLVDQEMQLDHQVRDLRDLLDQRSRLRREQADLQDPDEIAARRHRLQEAEEALATAEQHRESCDRAAHALELAQLRADQQKGQIDTLAAQLTEHHRARAAVAETVQLLATADAKAKDWADKLQTAEQAVTQTRQDVAIARQAVAAAMQWETARMAAARRRELTQRLTEYDRQQAALTTDRQQAGQGPDAATMAQLDELASTLRLARQSRDAAAATLSVRYHPGAALQLQLNGVPLADGAERALADRATLEVPGIATVTLQPARSADADAVPGAAAALNAALSDAGYDSVEAARAAHQDRQQAARRLQDGETTLALLAPKGREALLAERDALPLPPSGGGMSGAAAPDVGDADSVEADNAEADSGGGPGPDRSALEAQLAQTEQAQSTAEATQLATRSQYDRARDAGQTARAKAEAAAADLTRAEAGLPDVAAAEQQLADLQNELPTRQAAVAAADQQLAALRAAAPDLEQAQATAQRARSIQQSAHQRLQALTQDLAVLDTKIEHHASHAVEEQLAEIRDQRAAQETALAAIRFEIATLQRLDQALDQAQAGAQAQYLGPLMHELKPLVRRLWPEAELQVNADSVLPEHLGRGVVQDSIDQLSGGTQEQLSLLVRLAFARLLAKSGQAIPVILDDALAYTDDSRIEALFDALTLQADELQILVFSCRQKSFRNLGGTHLAIRAAASE
ncbi:AAA family ATPase [Phaeobacter sp.]|uniref:AAA family ATPase n=1 Tax=Phaeobacter sp. TaxID=1902409 RepID=UPI0025FC5A82|nr:AAA family ATPase [Phaeobacter sp.]